MASRQCLRATFRGAAGLCGAGALLLAFGVACGEGGGKRSDAAPDAGPEDGGPDIEPTRPAPPSIPILEPCPDGWRALPDPTVSDVVVCDPWPSGGRVDCEDDDTAQFPGGAGCERIGTPCPDGDWPEDLPVGADVIYVRAGEPPGGDGSLARPLATMGEGVAAGLGREGAIVAVAKGTYEEEVVIDIPVVVWGACVAETVIRAPDWHEIAATVYVFGPAGGEIRNLRITGRRWGIKVLAHEDPFVVDSVVVDRAFVGGVAGYGTGRIEVRNVAVRETEARLDGLVGYGLHAVDGAELVADRVVLERNRNAGILVAGEGSSLAASRVAVVDTLSHPHDGDLGVGVYVEENGVLDLRESVISGNRGAAILALGAGTLTVTDSVLEETRQQEGSTHAGGYGVYAYDTATVELSRVAVRRNRYAGMRVFDEGTRVFANDVVVVDSGLGDDTGLPGYGVGVDLGASLEADRLASMRNRTVGVVVVNPGTTATLRDLLVVDTLSHAEAGDLGYGAHAAKGASLSATRVRVEGSRRAGIFATDPETSVHLVDFEVTTTLPQDCAVDTCADESGGTGIASTEGAWVEASRFRVTDGALCGVQIATGGSMDLHEGLVARNPVGANVQTEGFDVRRIQDRVLYRENGRTIDGAALPVPEPFTDLGP